MIWTHSSVWGWVNPSIIILTSSINVCLFLRFYVLTDRHVISSEVKGHIIMVAFIPEQRRTKCRSFYERHFVLRSSASFYVFITMIGLIFFTWSLLNHWTDFDFLVSKDWDEPWPRTKYFVIHAYNRAMSFLPVRYNLRLACNMLGTEKRYLSRPTGCYAMGLGFDPKARTGDCLRMK